jgi:hypothetical protein
VVDWARITNTTISKYLKGAEPEILRNRVITAMLKERGRVLMNQSGLDLVWRVEYRRAPMTGYADTDVISFARQNRWKTATLPWRGYVISDSITKMERLKNKSTEQIVNVFGEMAGKLKDDMEEHFGDEVYIDGNATGNTKRFHGIESFMGTAGAATNGYIGTPSDTYAGLSTVLGNYGGTWDTSGGATTWPSGKGSPEYDFWSPLIVDYTDTLWTPTTKTWPNTCEEALRYAITKGMRNKSKRGQLDVFVIENELFRQLKDNQSAKERLTVARNEKGGLVALGFKGVMNLDGVDITTEYGLTTTLGYGWCFGACEILSLQESLFKPEGPFYNETDKSWRLSVDCIGNLRFTSPRNFVKLDNIT